MDNLPVWYEEMQDLAKMKDDDELPFDVAEEAASEYESIRAAHEDELYAIEEELAEERAEMTLTPEEERYWNGLDPDDQNDDL